MIIVNVLPYINLKNDESQHQIIESVDGGKISPFLVCFGHISIRIWFKLNSERNERKHIEEI